MAARGRAAHAARVAALRAMHDAGVVDYRACTPLPGATYEVGAPGGPRVLGPGEVIAYLRGALDAWAARNGRDERLESMLDGAAGAPRSAGEGRTRPGGCAGPGGPVAGR